MLPPVTDLERDVSGVVDETSPSEGVYLGCGTDVCGEHRTVGYRAWCFTCQEWCSPHAFCARGELAGYRAAYGELMLESDPLSRDS